MKKLFKQLKQINSFLHELDVTERNILELPYYKIFGNESERKKDLQEVNTKRAEYLNKKHNVLENIQIECEKQKYLVSAVKRNLKVA